MMFKNKFFLWILASVILGIIFYSLNTNNHTISPKNYIEQIQLSRKKLDENFINDTNSPIENKSSFKGLNYFEPDSSFRLMADYQTITSTQQGGFSMTDGSKGELKKVMTATGNLSGKTFVLSIFQEGDFFFLPFKDATNGKETYGGGRFINIPKENIKGNKILLDFNEAHNFYCAYNHTYVCPVPPTENFINLDIKAGEKILK